MKFQKKKTICLLLTIAFLLGLPVSAFAAADFAAPANLRWNETADGTVRYGFCSWNVVENCEGNYAFTLYRDSEKVCSTHYHDLYDINGLGRVTTGWSMSSQFTQEGDYYFTVCAEAGVDSEQGPVANSAVWKYVLPERALGVPTQIYWKDNTAYWAAVDNAAAYEVTYYKDGKLVGRSSSPMKKLDNGYYMANDTEFLLYLIEKNGEGVYTFTVQALSGDLTAVANGAVSATSTGNNLNETISAVNGSLDTLVSEINAATTTESAIQVRNKIVTENLSCSDLAAAMVSDSDIVTKLENLENAYQKKTGITVTVEKTTEAQITNDVSIIGAALNTSSSSITFKLDKPSKEYIVDELQYKNTVLLSMDLVDADVNEDGTLKVPVRITLPVPDNITIPENFRILHYHKTDDGYDVIMPVLSADKKYASFALTHFSDFMLAELVNDIDTGDNEPDTPSRPSSGGSSGGFSGSYNYPVKADGTGDATITFDKNYAVAGDTVTITVQPKAGRAVDEVIVTDKDDKVIAVTKVGDNKYGFTMPSGEVKVAVTTKVATYDKRIVLQINNHNVLINNKTLSNDVAPVIVDNRTMVPIRVITEALGGRADWNEATQTVTLTIDGNVLPMTIGQTLAGFDAAPVIINDRTYVPIRYVAEKMGAKVEWIANTQQIIIEK